MEGEFFTETDKVWGFEKQDFRGSFEAIRRQEGYYENIDSYKHIVSAVTTAKEKLAPRLDSVSRSTKSGAGHAQANCLGTVGCEIAH